VFLFTGQALLPAGVDAVTSVRLFDGCAETPLAKTRQTPFAGRASPAEMHSPALSVLERKLAKAERQAQAARERRAKAEARSRQVEQRLKRERAQATRALAERRETMGAAGRVAVAPRARSARPSVPEAAAKLAPLQ